MKKYLTIVRATTLSVMLLTLITLTVTGSVSAATKTATGKVQTSAPANAVGASVIVSCNALSVPTTTDSNGDFSVPFDTDDCAVGDTVTVNASLNGESASASQTVGNGAVVNFSVIRLAPIAVPEFGLITGIVSAVGAGGAYLGMRKKFFA